ncbi:MULTISPECIES: hypothetical protein [Clostridium]|uniref:hypothetical protein n=1 Tax=Clostridium TaxID=1485 RepID=UPI00232D7B04|nr:MULTISPECIES: hypothetical protein [Clostridium]MDB2104843.1 hypothetical protein [Clostridium paraputrificum]MDU2108691.1 hypothetical protein [Clostridium sp.]MDU3355198.1 hypothetical protein [Clostridium sp.]MDU4727944.1 hypothetical protein [Clostridium sp.]
MVNVIIIILLMVIIAEGIVINEIMKRYKSAIKYISYLEEIGNKFRDKILK